MNDQQNTARCAVLLVNLGSPESLEIPDVRRYLRQFLMDGRVLDAPYLIRKLIVELGILPFRPEKTAHAYRQIWWEEGSPLIVISNRVLDQLQTQLDIPAALAMRYGQPSIETGLRSLLQQEDALEEIYLIPLYPHYAMATYESVVVETQRLLEKLQHPVTLNVHPPFYDAPEYTQALVESARPYLVQDYDHLLVSYHGMPERHCRKTDPTGSHCFQTDRCCETPSEAHATCYRHQVFHTTEAFVRALEVPEEKYSIAFQSRLGMDDWLKPYTENEIRRLADSGVKKLQVICPAFVSDCLETLEEIGIRGEATFLEAGGEAFQLIPCLNDHPGWINTLKQWCINRSDL